MDPIISPHEFGARLRAARAYAGINQTEAAKLCGTTRQAYSRWEKGRVEPGSPARTRAAKGLSQAAGFPEAFFTDPDLQEFFRHPRFSIGQLATDTVQRLDPGQDESEHG